MFRRLRVAPNDALRTELVHRFMPLARRIALGYRTPDDHEDIEQVAYLGLVKAVDGYDPDRGTSFLTYAIPTIAGEVKRHFRDHTWSVHLPRGLQVRAVSAQRVSDELAAELGHTPTVEQIARRLGADHEATLEALAAAGARDTRSFDEPITSSDGFSTLGEVAAPSGPDDRFGRVEDREAVRAALARLSDRERKVVGLRFLCEMTQSEIADRIGVSQMAVSRIVRRTIERMSKTAAGL